MYLEVPVNAVFSFNVGDGNIFLELAHIMDLE